MTLDIRTTYKEHQEAPRVLAEEIEARMIGLFEIRITIMRQKNYYPTPLGVGEIDKSDAPGSVVAREVWKLCREHARRKGSARYRCEYLSTVEGESGVIFSEGLGFDVTVDDDGSVGVGSPSAEVNVWSVVKDMVKDPHVRYCELLDRIPPLLDAVTAGSERRGKYDVELRRLDLEQAKDEATSEVHMEFVQRGSALLQQFAEPFGVNLADVAEDWLRDNMKTAGSAESGGANAEQPAPKSADPLLRKWRRLWDAIESEGSLEKIETILGEDLWGLAGAMRHAADDQEFTGQARAFSARVADRPDRQEVLMGIAMALGEKHALQMRNILNRAVGE